MICVHTLSFELLLTSFICVHRRVAIKLSLCVCRVIDVHARVLYHTPHRHISLFVRSPGYGLVGHVVVSGHADDVRDAAATGIGLREPEEVTTGITATLRDGPGILRHAQAC